MLSLALGSTAVAAVPEHLLPFDASRRQAAFEVIGTSAIIDRVSGGLFISDGTVQGTSAPAPGEGPVPDRGQFFRVIRGPSDQLRAYDAMTRTVRQVTSFVDADSREIVTLTPGATQAFFDAGSYSDFSISLFTAGRAGQAQLSVDRGAGGGAVLGERLYSVSPLGDGLFTATPTSSLQKVSLADDGAFPTVAVFAPYAGRLVRPGAMTLNGSRVPVLYSFGSTPTDVVRVALPGDTQQGGESITLSDPRSYSVVNGKLLFSLNGDAGVEIYRFDGATVELVKDIVPGGGDFGSYPRLFSGQAFSALLTNGGSRWIFWTDGTTEGTRPLVKPSSFLMDLVSSGSTVVYTDLEHRIWSVDATTLGVTQLYQASGPISGLTWVGEDRVLFVAPETSGGANRVWTLQIPEPATVVAVGGAWMLLARRRGARRYCAIQ